MEPTCTIRRYEPSDFHACRSLWAELTEHHRMIYEDATIGGDDPGQAFESYLGNDDLAGPWVAVDGDTVIALSGLIIHGKEAELEPLIVSPKYRSQGVGTKLMRHVIQEARERGVRFLSVKPVARNVAAFSFFVNAGFDLLGHVDLFQDLDVSSDRTWRSGISIHGENLRY